MRHSALPIPALAEPDFYIDVFLQPGEFYFGERDTRIRTLLGSCVAITLWHPRLQIGGMCHYMLPQHHHRRAHERLDGRYAEDALQMFLREIRKSHTHVKEYEVKMFGGGNQFPQHGISKITVPDKNIERGRELIARNGLKLQSEHMGGVGHRNVMFELWSGDVWVKHVEKIV